jgi:hypothetical protein
MPHDTSTATTDTVIRSSKIDQVLKKPNSLIPITGHSSVKEYQGTTFRKRRHEPMLPL